MRGPRRGPAAGEPSLSRTAPHPLHPPKPQKLVSVAHDAALLVNHYLLLGIVDHQFRTNTPKIPNAALDRTDHVLRLDPQRPSIILLPTVPQNHLVEINRHRPTRYGKRPHRPIVLHLLARRRLEPRGHLLTNDRLCPQPP